VQAEVVEARRRWFGWRFRGFRGCWRRFWAGDHVVLLLCGGNVSLEDVCAFRRQFREGPVGATPADRP